MNIDHSVNLSIPIAKQVSTNNCKSLTLTVNSGLRGWPQSILVYVHAIGLEELCYWSMLSELLVHLQAVG